jgi:hypothetical protein
VRGRNQYPLRMRLCFSGRAIASGMLTTKVQTLASHIFSRIFPKDLGTRTHARSKI